jgi:hypothetical protein
MATTIKSIFDPDLRDELVEYTKSIFRRLQSDMNLSYDDMLESLCGSNILLGNSSSFEEKQESKNTTTNSKNKCCAIVAKTKKPCERFQMKNSMYCKAHQKLADKAPPSSEPEQRVKESVPAVLEMIYLNEKQFLLDAGTSKVYTFEDVPKHVGELNSSGNMS